MSAGTHRHTPGHPGGHGHGHGIGAVRPEGFVYSRAPMIVYWEVDHGLRPGLPALPGHRDARRRSRPAEHSRGPGPARRHRHVRQSAAARRVHRWRPAAPGRSRPADRRGRRPGDASSRAPAVTPPDRRRLAEVQEAGVQAISLSLDGSDAEHHDGVRGVPGTFDLTVRALDDAAPSASRSSSTRWSPRRLLMTCPRCTRCSRANVDALEPVLPDLRGPWYALTEMTPVEAERLMHWLEVCGEAPFQVKTAEAMAYRRVVAPDAWSRTTDEQIEASPLAARSGSATATASCSSPRTARSPVGFHAVRPGQRPRDTSWWRSTATTPASWRCATSRSTRAAAAAASTRRGAALPCAGARLDRRPPEVRPAVPVPAARPPVHRRPRHGRVRRVR